jgi:hypothetical protein
LFLEELRESFEEVSCLKKKENYFRLFVGSREKIEIAFDDFNHGS